MEDEDFEKAARESPCGRDVTLLRLLDKARAAAKYANADANMYANAWQRELSAIGFRKRHHGPGMVRIEGS